MATAVDRSNMKTGHNYLHALILVAALGALQPASAQLLDEIIIDYTDLARTAYIHDNEAAIRFLVSANDTEGHVAILEAYRREQGEEG
jgi:hypothetical protein